MWTVDGGKYEYYKGVMSKAHEITLTMIVSSFMLNSTKNFHRLCAQTPVPLMSWNKFWKTKQTKLKQKTKNTLKNDLISK